MSESRLSLGKFYSVKQSLSYTGKVQLQGRFEKKQGRKLAS